MPSNHLACALFSICLTTPALGQALNLTEFIDCVGSNAGGYGATCTLAAGVYHLTTAIPIFRSNITIQGDPSQYLGTQLVRGSTGLSRMLYFNRSVSGITFYNLAFNGNKALFGGSYPDTFRDLDLFGQPLSGGSTTTISNCEFDDSPSYAIFAQYHLHINSCTFKNAVYTSLWTWSSNNSVTDIYVQNATFLDDGGGGIVLDGGASTSVISNNTLYGNHWTCPAFSSGGQIDVPQHSSNVLIYGNVVDANHWDGTPATACANGTGYAEGLEIYGVNHNITYNQVRNHLVSGMYFDTAGMITIDSNTIWNNLFDGITIRGSVEQDPALCANPPAFSIVNNLIGYNSGYAVQIIQDVCSNGPNSSTVTAPLPPSNNYNNLTNNGSNTIYYH